MEEKLRSQRRWGEASFTTRKVSSAKVISETKRRHVSTNGERRRRRTWSSNEASLMEIFEWELHVPWNGLTEVLQVQRITSQRRCQGSRGRSSLIKLRLPSTQPRKHLQPHEINNPQTLPTPPLPPIYSLQPVALSKNVAHANTPTKRPKWPTTTATTKDGPTPPTGPAGAPSTPRPHHRRAMRRTTTASSPTGFH